MKILHSQNRIAELMSVFVTQVKATTAMNRTDINWVAETILVPLLREVYGYKRLKNLNSEDGQNYPGVDLGDESARVAIQVTSTSSAEKIKHTLEKFVQHGLHNKYDRVIVYVLTEKQKSYSGRGFSDIIENRFQFDKDKDILDYTDLLSQVSTFQVDRARRVEQILEANFGDGQMLQFGEEDGPETEAVYLNLLEVFFPDTLYIADIDKNTISCEDGAGSHTKRRSSARDGVRAAMQREGFKFALDWECHAGKIITFHDLRDPTLPLSRVTDWGTVTPLSPDEFYEIDADHANVFKSLLARCLQQKLYRKQINWQNEDKQYIFTEQDGNPKRREQWIGQKRNERGVYWRMMKRDEPEKVFYCKHLAFQTQFHQLGNQWFLGIRPEWFFSYDGYKRSFYAAEKIKYLKKKERNKQVFDHLRAIAYLIKHDKPSDLFVQSYRYPFLSFGDLVSLDGAPRLDDKEWLSGESKEDREKYEAEVETMEDGDTPLHLDL